MSERINAPAAAQADEVKARITELREKALEQAYMYAKTKQPNHLAWLQDYRRDIEVLEWVLAG